MSTGKVKILPVGDNGDEVPASKPIGGMKVAGLAGASAEEDAVPIRIGDRRPLALAEAAGLVPASSLPPVTNAEGLLQARIDRLRQDLGDAVRNAGILNESLWYVMDKFAAGMTFTEMVKANPSLGRAYEEHCLQQREAAAIKKRNRARESKDDYTRAIALQKLTEEEKILLGLAREG